MKINPSLPGLDQGKATTGTNGDQFKIVAKTDRSISAA